MLMNRYLYDGTADGLLSAIAWILEEEPDPEQVALAERHEPVADVHLVRFDRRTRRLSVERGEPVKDVTDWIRRQA